MNALKIPGYQTLIPGDTYSREAEPVTETHSGRPVPATSIIQLKRCLIPTEDEIIAHIREAAGLSIILQQFPIPEGQQAPEQTGLQSIIAKFFSTVELASISSGEKDALAQLRMHYSINEKCGGQYISMSGGVIPNEMLAQEAEKIREMGYAAYLLLIKRTDIRQWDARVRTTETGGLPGIREINYLLKRGVRDCNMFEISREYDSQYPEFTDFLTALCRTPDSPQKVKHITDISQKVLDFFATKTAKSAAGHKAADRAAEYFAAIISTALESTLHNPEENNSSKPILN